MKKTILLSIIFLSINILAYRTTSDVAQEMGYYNFINDLRGDVNEYLDHIFDQFKLYRQTLNATHHHELAESQHIKFIDLHESLKNEFDRKFEDIDRVLVLQGDKLNDFNTPAEVKSQLVKKLHDDAKAEIKKITDRTNAKIERLKVNLYI